jgi:hypothetical protein
VSPSAVAGHSIQDPATTQVSGFIVPVYDRYEVCKRLVRMVVASRGRILLRARSGPQAATLHQRLLSQCSPHQLEVLRPFSPHP